ncbi:hypothetical protein [Desulfotalea psychrophila]|uniref:Uncharacterized protein n=1 Tax=Desulfotalea psychrophila (strain LSv54 / DSM 12343) TaxID=177439 RepID=Q6APE7_DESPS|nr:hypothetical protein [Desulfotalea psychrophila]CAG35777.1 unknown protein [Desulfotalea psychrophila LSv54]
MKMFIGITQDLQEASKNISKDFQGMQICTELGPFISSSDASQWMEFMIARSENMIPILPLPAISQGSAWYGYTLEDAGSDIL